MLCSRGFMNHRRCSPTSCHGMLASRSVCSGGTTRPCSLPKCRRSSVLQEKALLRKYDTEQKEYTESTLPEFERKVAAGTLPASATRPAAPLQKLPKQQRALVEHRELVMKRARVIVVHCTHGFNRSGYMLVHYLMRNNVTATVAQCIQACGPLAASLSCSGAVSGSWLRESLGEGVCLLCLVGARASHCFWLVTQCNELPDAVEIVHEAWVLPGSRLLCECGAPGSHHRSAPDPMKTHTQPDPPSCPLTLTLTEFRRPCSARHGRGPDRHACAVGETLGASPIGAPPDGRGLRGECVQVHQGAAPRHLQGRVHPGAL